MIRRGTARTGIDLGRAAVKVVRGVGGDRLESVTHAGWEPVDGDGADPRLAVAALAKLMRRLGLKPRQLGRVAVGCEAAGSAFREIETAPMTDAELRRSMRYEAHHHLDLAGIADPIIDFQVLGAAEAPGDGEGPAPLRVLLAAVDRPNRDRLLASLRGIGIVPAAIDLQPLAAVNAVLGVWAPPEAAAVGVMDVGEGRTALYLSGWRGALLGRAVHAAGAPDPDEPVEKWCDAVAGSVQETLVFYRGRHRRTVGRILVVGRGALRGDLVAGLQARLEPAVSAFDPFADLDRGKSEQGAPAGTEPLFAAACGLCRSWDGDHV